MTSAEKTFWNQWNQFISRGIVFLITCFAVAVWQDSTAAGFAFDFIIGGLSS